MRSTYLLVDLFTIIVPFLFSFHPKLRFHLYFKYFFAANFVAGFIFICWDIYFTKLGVWGFNPEYVLGAYVYNLPVEEILFFICIPFSCVFTYHCLNIFYKFQWKKKNIDVFIIILSLILFITGVSFYYKLYTSSTFISLSLLLLFLHFYIKVNWLSKLFTIYPVLLIPFFIVNGILTGTGLENPVVWYNNSHNLGIRLLTIPLEDIFYGLELIILNISIFEYLKKKYLSEKKII